jgi:hypothetical protein
VSGTSSNVATVAPNGLGDVVDNSVTWRSATPYRRSGFYLRNGSATDSIWPSWAGTPVAGRGVQLDAGDELWLSGSETPQAEVLVAATSSVSVLSLEW